MSLNMANGPEIDHDFFDDGPNKGDKSPFAISKNSFHKNAAKESDSEEVSSASSNSEYESSDESHSNEHGMNGNSYQSSSKSDQNSTLKSSNRSSSYSSDNDTSLDSQSLESSDEKNSEKNVSNSMKHDINKKTVFKRKPKMIKILSSSSQNGNSSDSVTDVSPLTSPEGSPSLGRFVIPKPLQTNEQNVEPFQHITKLNVTFTGSSGATKATHRSDNKGAAHSHHEEKQNISNSYSGGTYAWSSNSDDESEVNKHFMGRDKTNRSMKNKKQLHIRQNYASTNHRQRLLDSAARGSMDVSSLLETVLEFEKNNLKHKVDKDEESQMNYRIGEQLLKGKQRKNMSFSNDQVRDIDRENRRLLNQITSRSRPSSASSVRSNASLRSNVSRSSSKSTLSRPGSSRRPDSAKPCKLYHTALNRIQQQRQIERENMQMLKRLQTAKPTSGLQRQRLLADHKRQSDYMGTSLNRSGMSLKKAQELTRNAEVVQRAIGLHKSPSRPVKPAWQDSW